MKLSSKTAVKVVANDSEAVFVFNTPWHDPGFKADHKHFLDSRFETIQQGKKSVFHNNRAEAQIEFGKKYLVEVTGIEYDEKPIMEVDNWKEAIPTHLLTTAVSYIFEESETEADVLKKSVVSST